MVSFLYRYGVLFTMLFFFESNANAQYNIDSLKVIVSAPTFHDTTRLATIAVLIDNLYENKDVEKYNNLMGKIAQNGLSKTSNKALKKKYTIYLAAYYNNISFQLEQTRDPKALGYLNKSIELYNSIDALDEMYTTIVSKGLLLSRDKRYKEAIDCYFSALKYFELNEEENADGISYVYSNLGGLYGDQGQNKTAIQYLKKAILYLDKKKEDQTVEDDLQKCAMCYNIGAKYIILQNYKEAEKYLNQSLALSTKHDQRSYMSFALGKLAEVDIFFKKYDDAEKRLLKSNEIADSDLASAFSVVNLGNLYFEMKKYDKAKEVLDEGLKLSESTKNNDLLSICYNLLYKLNKIQGNYKESIAMLELYNTIEDSSKVAETRNELKQQQLKYDYEKKELNYKLIAQEKSAAKNNLLLGLAALFLLLLIGVYFLYRNYKHKQTISLFEKNELKQKLLLTQMNPHFIFNSIDNIQSLINNKQDKEAVSYLTKFSKLTRQILENSSENYISLREEITMIDNYIAIQQLLYNNKFNYTLDVAEGLDQDMILLPPMLTQPFIENAIKHGLKNTSQKGFLSIRFFMEDNKLFFEVIDNGTGFSNAEKESKNKSLALKITKERLKTIGKKNHFEVHTQNVVDANATVLGAKVYFEIPYIYEN